MAKFRINRLEDRIVPSALCCVCDGDSSDKGGSDKSCKNQSSKSDKSCKVGSSKKDRSSKSEKCGSSKKEDRSEKCKPAKGNNGFGNGGHDGSPNGKQDKTR